MIDPGLSRHTHHGRHPRAVRTGLGHSRPFQRTRRAWNMDSDHADHHGCDMDSDHVSARGEALVAAARLPAAADGSVSCGSSLSPR